jgi:hypothetical protein
MTNPPKKTSRSHPEAEQGIEFHSRAVGETRLGKLEGIMHLLTASYVVDTVFGFLSMCTPFSPHIIPEKEEYEGLTPKFCFISPFHCLHIKKNYFSCLELCIVYKTTIKGKTAKMNCVWLI